MDERIESIKNQLQNKHELFIKIQENWQDGRKAKVSLSKDEAKSLIGFYAEIAYQIAMMG